VLSAPGFCATGIACVIAAPPGWRISTLDGEARLIATLALTARVNVIVDFGAPEQPEVVNTCNVPV
jgi:hypothetical protein